MFARSIKNEFCYDVRLYSGVSYSFSIHTNRWIFIARERFRCRRSRCFHITLFSIINHRKIAVGRVLGQHWRLDTSMADTDLHLRYSYSVSLMQEKKTQIETYFDAIFLNEIYGQSICAGH